jgi:hypothetical protein
MIMGLPMLLILLNMIVYKNINPNLQTRSYFSLFVSIFYIHVMLGKLNSHCFKAQLMAYLCLIPCGTGAGLSDTHTETSGTSIHTRLRQVKSAGLAVIAPWSQGVFLSVTKQNRTLVDSPFGSKKDMHSTTVSGLNHSRFVKVH